MIIEQGDFHNYIQVMSRITQKNLKDLKTFVKGELGIASSIENLKKIFCACFDSLEPHIVCESYTKIINEMTKKMIKKEKILYNGSDSISYSRNI